jgi:hypothetical protein
MKVDDKRDMYGENMDVEEPGVRSVGIGAGTDGSIDAWDDEIDPTLEDAYWRENFRGRPYVSEGETYDPYDAAYRTAYENYDQYRGRTFDDVESDLRQDYEQRGGQSAMAWEKAKEATRDAWRRIEEYLQSEAENARH